MKVRLQSSDAKAEQQNNSLHSLHIAKTYIISTVSKISMKCVSSYRIPLSGGGEILFENNQCVF